MMHKMTRELGFLLFLGLSVWAVTGCQGKDSGILGGDTVCNIPETWSTRFSANGNTVVDGKKGLLWTLKVKSDMKWQEADDYCKGLNLDGKKWRLPSKSEFRALLNECPLDNGCRLSPVFEGKCGIFWVSSSYKNKDTGAELYGFVDAQFGGDGFDNPDEGHLVRCVSSNK